MDWAHFGWQGVALAALGTGAWFAHRLAISAKAEDALQGQVAALANALEHTRQSMFDGQQRWAGADVALGELRDDLGDLRKRLETAELRKLGGGR